MANKKDKTFEEALNELEVLVKELESGNVALEDAIKKYTDAMNLAKSCSDILNDATEKVNKILKDGELKDFSLEEK